jgi:hypothetical protein
VVPLERRLGSRLADPPLRQRIDVGRRHAGNHDLPKLGENPRDELIHSSKLLNLALRTADDHTLAPFYRRAAAASSIIVMSS